MLKWPAFDYFWVGLIFWNNLNASTTDFVASEWMNITAKQLLSSTNFCFLCSPKWLFSRTIKFQYCPRFACTEIDMIAENRFLLHIGLKNISSLKIEHSQRTRYQSNALGILFFVCLFTTTNLPIKNSWISYKSVAWIDKPRACSIILHSVCAFMLEFWKRLHRHSTWMPEMVYRWG